MTTFASKVNTIRNWIKRRERKGVHPNADAIDARIKANWPSLTTEEREAIYQAI